LCVFCPPASQITWYELPSFYVFHFANAWEDEAGRVVLCGCQSDFIDLGATSFREDMGSRMTRYVIDPKAGKASREQVRTRVEGAVHQSVV
jgi:carotenoid cleavage dioxygenase-like enzyme